MKRLLSMLFFPQSNHLTSGDFNQCNLWTVLSNMFPLPTCEHSQGLQHIFWTITGTFSSSDSLPDDLNTSCARFESFTHLDHSTLLPSFNCLISLHKALRRINPRKAAAPDNISGWALRACATELTDVFTSIFNLSLSQSTVPTCFKRARRPA